ncbi:MAG: Rrf2 family transcriptional regulator [Rickettsiales bacterium]|nr:Rrf2 family transcriptional regulator [Rickettsiales bacterium]
MLTSVAYYASAGRPISSAELEAHYRLNKRALEPILQPLVKAGILISVSGNQGGYYVAKDATLNDIIQALSPTGKTLKATTHEFSPILKPLMHQLQDEFSLAAANTKLSDITASAEEAGIIKQWMHYEDYVI